MPGRWSGARWNFARPWSIQLGRDLNQLLRRLGDGMSNLQASPAAPEDVELDGTPDAGVGPSPALDDHVHNLPAAAPSNPTGATAAEGSSSSVLRADATIKQGIVTTKGDILAFSTFPARHAVGNDGEVLVADSSQATGLAWSSAAEDAEFLAWIGL
jgi:hypothetical protein